METLKTDLRAVCGKDGTAEEFPQAYTRDDVALAETETLEVAASSMRLPHKRSNVHGKDIVRDEHWALTA